PFVDHVCLGVVAQDAVLTDLCKVDVLTVPYRTFGEELFCVGLHQQLEFPCHLFFLYLIRFFDEDEGRSFHDGRTRADEGDVDVLDLAFTRTSRRLQCALDDMPETVDAPGAQTSAEGIERQLAVELDAAVLNEVERLALVAESVRLETVNHRGG